METHTRSVNNIILDGRQLSDTPYHFKNDDELHVLHNAGFFSNGTIALQSILMYWNYWHKFPSKVHREHQYLYYKHRPTDNLIPMLFKETDEVFPYTGNRYMTNSAAEQQFSDYKQIRFSDVLPFVQKYFMPSDLVMERVKYFEDAYQIDYENTCGVFYRGNDKGKETVTPNYSDFIDKSMDVFTRGMRFFVMPDELEFWKTFQVIIAPSFRFDELPLFPHNSEQSIFHQLEPKDLPDHAVNFFAQVLIGAKCKHVITHSGNGSFWLALYRGHTNNFHQFLNGQWL